MIIIKDLREELDWLRSKNIELEELQKQYPLFKIMKTRNGGREVYYKVYKADGKRKRRIVKYRGPEFYDILKGICIDTKRKMINDNRNLLKKIQPLYWDIDPVGLMAAVYRDNPKLDIHDISVAVSEIEHVRSAPSEWALAPYKRSEYREDEKIHTTSRGLKVRSKSEAAICEIFYANGIEFRYEEIIYVNGRRLVPDFVIRRKSDGKIFYWEHCGMMEDPAYRRNNREKLGWYESSGIVPWDNLIVTYDKDGAIDLKYIEAIVQAVLAA